MVSCFSGATTMVVCISGFERLLAASSKPIKELDDMEKPISVADFRFAGQGQVSTRDELWNLFYENTLVPVAKSGRYHYTPFGRADIKTRDEFLQQHFGGMTSEEVRDLARAHRVSFFSEAVNEHSRIASHVYNFLQHRCGMGCEEIKGLADALNVPLFDDHQGETYCVEFSW